MAVASYRSIALFPAGVFRSKAHALFWRLQSRAQFSIFSAIDSPKMDGKARFKKSKEKSPPFIFTSCNVLLFTKCLPNFTSFSSLDKIPGFPAISRRLSFSWELTEYANTFRLSSSKLTGPGSQFLRPEALAASESGRSEFSIRGTGTEPLGLALALEASESGRCESGRSSGHLALEASESARCE